MKIMKTRREFIKAAAVTVAGTTFYLASSAQAVFPLFVGISARSLVLGGARAASRSAIRSALMNGAKRAGKRPSRTSSSLTAELNSGLNFSVSTNVPIWKSGDSKNHIDFQLQASLSKATDVPLILQARDIDTGEVEQQAEYTLYLPDGEINYTVECPLSFNQVIDGRKHIIGGVPKEFANKVSIRPEPYVLSLNE